MANQRAEHKFDSSELFPGYRNNPIVDQITAKLQPYKFDVFHFRVMRNSEDFQRLSEFLACTLEELPLNNEVGKTYLLRPDAISVIKDLTAVLRGRKTWEEIAGIFTPTQLYKNKVYPSHNLGSVICHSIDVFGDESAFSIDRIHITTTDQGVIKARYDGKFTIRPHRITVEADDSPMLNIHKGYSKIPN